MTLINRQAARDAGMRFYFTSIACRNGHLAERRVSSGKCVACEKASNTKAYAKDKEVIKARSAAWYAENKERASAAGKLRYQNNPEAKIGSGKWAKENPEKRAAIASKWAAENPEKVAAAKKKWNAANPEAIRLKLRRRRARINGAEGNHTTADIETLLHRQNYKCAVCGTSIEDSSRRDIDHIVPLARGGSNWPDNLQALCRFCNRSKGARDPITFAHSIGRLFL